MSGFVVAALVGVGIAVQVKVLGSSSSTHHPLAVSMSLQLAGVLAGLMWTTVRSDWRSVGAIATSWWWVPLGVGGWLVVAALGYASSRIGVATTLGVSVAVQLVLGLLLDATGAQGGVSGSVVLGAVFVVAGVVLVAM
jgi:bacterial/archaeal transporter family-2 protein